MQNKSQKLESLLREVASEFLARESNRQSLITVTNVHLLERDRKAEICVTVFPDNREKQALDFLARKRRDFAKYLTEHTRLQYLPKVVFSIDEGEKNRQRIDELLRQG